MADYSDDPTENGIYMDCLNMDTRIDTRNTYTNYKHPHGNGNQSQHRAVATWGTLAAILDRLFFLVYLLVIILSTVFIFPR